MPTHRLGRIGLVLAAGALLVVLSHASPSDEADDDILVGVHYFCGWWKGPGDKWLHNGKPWLPDFPQRRPLLGQYNSQTTMDAEIDAASSYGVKYFDILYYDNLPTPREPGSVNLNQCVPEFMQSPNAHKMSFMLTWCNTYPLYAVHNDTEWEELVESWLPAFAHPSYLRIDNRLVWKVINVGSLLQNCNNNRTLLAERMTYMTDRVREAGLGEMILGAGTGPLAKALDPVQQWGYNFSWTGLYGGVPPGEPLQLYPWSVMTNYTMYLNKVSISQDKIPFVPNVMSGWDALPWGGENRPRFEFPTLEQWTAELQQLKSLIQSSPVGFPNSDGSLTKTFMTYSWGEYGEGGLVAPTAGYNYTILEGLRNVFGPPNTA